MNDSFTRFDEDDKAANSAKANGYGLLCTNGGEAHMHYSDAALASCVGSVGEVPVPGQVRVVAEVVRTVGPAPVGDMDAYQFAAMRTANTNPKAATREARLLNFALGLAGEAGEVADLVKKHVFHEHPLDEDKLLKELGDCLWYLTATAWCLGKSLAAVATLNVLKLSKRYPNGFAAQRSINRAPEDT